MKVVKFEPAHFDEIDFRDIEKVEFSGVYNLKEAVNILATNKHTYTCLDDADKPILVGGISVLWRGVGEAFIYASDLEKLGGPEKLFVLRNVKDYFHNARFDAGLHRIQAHVNVRYEKFINFVEWLGFEKEGIMRKYGVDGSDYYSYFLV